MSTAALDGTITSVVKEITKLHSEILTAARTSLSKAIRIGELLCRVRLSRKGKWLLWLDEHVPFTRQTACNYMRCFERRAELECKNVLHLSDAYAFLALPANATVSTQRESANGRAGSPTVADEHKQASVAPVEQSQPQRRHKSQKQIMKELQRISEREQEVEKQANAQLTEIIATLGNKVRAQWLEFPTHLKSHGATLIKLSERLALNTPKA